MNATDRKKSGKVYPAACRTEVCRLQSAVCSLPRSRILNSMFNVGRSMFSFSRSTLHTPLSTLFPVVGRASVPGVWNRRQEKGRRPQQRHPTWLKRGGLQSMFASVIHPISGLQRAAAKSRLRDEDGSAVCGLWSFFSRSTFHVSRFTAFMVLRDGVAV